MRATVLVSLAWSLALAGAAIAGDVTNPVWTKAPGQSDWAKAYPADAAKAGISGSVKLRCKAGADGALTGCLVVQESPTGEGFAQAALFLTSDMQLRSTTASGQPTAGQNIVVPIKFDPGLLHGPVSLTNPDWVRIPSAQDVMNYIPVTASGGGGRAKMECVVSDRGMMERCAIQSEDPAGQGFGAAALAMSAIFVMNPMTVDGSPVGGAKIIIPIHFEGSATRSESVAVQVLRAAPWSATPTQDQMAAAFPKNAAGKTVSGHVVLRCAIKNDGGLQDCETLTEQPKGLGFDHAAHSLTREFRAIVNPKTDKLTDLRVDVPFTFQDPAHPAPPLEIYDPLWLKSVDPGSAYQLFPEAAAKAGLKSGLTILHCGVAHDGTLTDCSIENEDPPGMGFGAAALKIAGVVEMNPWTPEGAPVDGARVRLPLRLNASDGSTPVPPAPAKP